MNTPRSSSPPLRSSEQHRGDPKSSTTTRYRLVAPDRSVVVPELDEHQQRVVDHEGGLRWNGREVEDPQVFLRPGQVAFVAQVPRVLSGSFAGNLRLDHDREPDRAVEDARLAQDVGEAGGIEAIVGHRGVRLSGGQVQRLALARALYGDPRLLVLDEPNSNLDHPGEAALVSAIRTARARGAVVVLIAHRPSMVSFADKILVLEHGTVRHFGPRDEVMRLVSPDSIAVLQPKRPEIRIIPRRVEGT